MAVGFAFDEASGLVILSKINAKRPGETIFLVMDADETVLVYERLAAMLGDTPQGARKRLDESVDPALPGQGDSAEGAETRKTRGTMSGDDEALETGIRYEDDVDPPMRMD